MSVRCTLRLLSPVLALLMIPAFPPASRAARPDPAPQEALQLSVEEAVLLALRNNRDLRVRRLEPALTGAFAQLERGVFDPELFAELEVVEERAAETSRSTGEQFDVEATDTRASAGVRQFLSTGTTLEGAVEQLRSSSNRAPEQQVARLGLTVTQSLLQGFGPAVNLAAVRQAELDIVASGQQLRAFTETLLFEAETGYWNYVLAEKQIAIFESALAVARQQRDETELRIEVGLLPEVEAAAARAEVARREQALIDARSLLEERRLRLLRLLNAGTGRGFDQRLRATSEPRTPAVAVNDLEARLELAATRRPELNAARLQLAQQRLETVVTRNGLLPRLDFFITLGKTGYADSFSGSFRELDGNTYDLRAGLQFSRPVGNRAARARNRAAQTSREQARAAVANLEQLVRLDVRLAANELERVRQQIAATAVTRALQEETLAAEQERFAVGASTTLLVAQAQRDLLASQIAEVEAIVNYRIALVELFLAEGTLLERRGIRVDR